MVGWMDGWMDGWMGGWMDGRKCRFKDCLQQSTKQGVKNLSLIIGYAVSITFNIF